MNEAPNGSTGRKPGRRRLQFSLRMVFVVITLCALLLGLAIWRVRRHEEAIDAVEKLGGSVTLGDELHVPRWLRGFVFRDVIAIDLDGTGATNAHLARIKGLLKRLETLKLDHTRITAGALEHLTGLSSLGKLSLAETSINDADLAQLERLDNLIWLDLSGTPVTDAGLEHLAGLTTLEYLDISDTLVTDAGLEHLRGLAALKRLDLEASQISATSIEHIAGLSRLERMLVYVSSGNGKRAHDLVKSSFGLSWVPESIALLRPRLLFIWGTSHSSRWEAMPAGVAETIQWKAELNPEEAAKLLELLAERLARGKWGRRPRLRAPPARLAEKDWITSVEELVKDDDQEVRSAVADGLVSIVEEDWQEAAAVVPVLLKMLQDKSSRVRQSVVRALDRTAQINPYEAKAALPVLFDMLRTEDAQIKAHVVEALGLVLQDLPHEAGPAVPVFLGMLCDEDPRLSKAATEALGHIVEGDPDEVKTIIPVLLEMLQTGDEPTRETAEAALGAVADGIIGHRVR